MLDEPRDGCTYAARNVFHITLKDEAVRGLGADATGLIDSVSAQGRFGHRVHHAAGDQVQD